MKREAAEGVASLRPAAAANLPLEIAASLREAILGGRFAPGTRLKEVGIAEQMGTSRAPVREAILMLEQEGLVVRRPRRGCSVAPLEPRDGWEIYSLRGLLEAEAVRVTRPEDLVEAAARLRRVVRRMEALKDGQVDRALGLDIEFHQILVSRTANRRLQRMHQSMNPLVGFLFYMALRALSMPITGMAAAHEPVLKMAQKGAVASTATLVADHYTSRARVLLRRGGSWSGGEAADEAADEA